MVSGACQCGFDRCGMLTDVGPPPADPAKRAYADRVLFAAMTRATVRLEVVETG